GNAEWILARMLREYDAEQPGYIGVLKSLLMDLLINIYRGYRARNAAFNKGEQYRYDIIWDAVDYLKKNHSSKLNLDEVCRHFYLSKSYFTRVFRKATGMSAFEYLQKVRVDEACRLLAETSRKINDIAEAVGYQDYNFFNRTFKKVTGCTAREYRMQRPSASRR
ncbi:MAG TPA: hypothetical protein DD727_07410, partial [Clostridiales bacterium]|nr:hypothetical protein [Clostridiales bacterium]